jgi:hypothetical protein
MYSFVRGFVSSTCVGGGVLGGRRSSDLPALDEDVTGTRRLAYYAVFAGVAIATLVWIAAAWRRW